jgi:hypothetical protein
MGVLRRATRYHIRHFATLRKLPRKTLRRCLNLDLFPRALTTLSAPLLETTKSPRHEQALKAGVMGHFPPSLPYFTLIYIQHWHGAKGGRHPCAAAS